MKDFGRWFADLQAPQAPKPEREEDLPDGLWMSGDTVMYACMSCGKATEWPAEIADFDINNHANQCGRSDRCCP